MDCGNSLFFANVATSRCLLSVTSSLPTLVLFGLFVALPQLFQRASSADLHIHSEEIEQLIQSELRLLGHAEAEDDVDLVTDDIADFFGISPDRIADHPLNVLYLYIHWWSLAGLWPRMKAPRDEVNAFLSQLPSSEDVHGVAHHIIRLQDVYNLTVEHVLGGQVMGLKAVRPMRMPECFLMADAAYKAGMQDEFQLWIDACRTLPKTAYNEDEKEVARRDSKRKSFERRRRNVMELLLSSSGAAEVKARKEAWTSIEKDTVESQSLSQMLTKHLATTNKTFQKRRPKRRSSGKNDIKEAMYESYKKLCQQTVQEGATLRRPMPSQEQLEEDLYCFVDTEHFTKVELLSSAPLVVFFHQLLPDSLIRQIVEATGPNLEAPRTVSAKSGAVDSDSATRSGKVAFIHDQLQEEQPQTEAILSKMKALTGLVSGLNTKDPDSTEALQVVHYSTGGHYEPHVDYFGPEIASADTLRGDRVATMLYYLSHEALGGATVFPFLNVAVKPERGSALFWFNTHRHANQGDPLSLHAGCPILGGGTKWIANLWIRERPQIFHRPCRLDEE